MSNLICGAIAVSMSLVFLLFYAIRLESIALWIIIVGNLVFLLVDYVQTIKQGNNQKSS
jgi:hypothetical protein